MKRIGLFMVALSAFALGAAELAPLSLPVGGLKPGAVVKVSGETALRTRTRLKACSN